MIKKDLFDTSASLYVLSCLMRNPLLLQNDKYSFVKTDFYKPLQQMVFITIYNMAQNGVERITPQDIDLYISIIKPIRAMNLFLNVIKQQKVQMKSNLTYIIID